MMKIDALEVIARALCVDDDVDPDAVDYDRTRAARPNWYCVRGTADAILTALEARGYVIVPSELDSKDMDHWYVADAGIKVIEDYGGEMGDDHTPEMQISTVYKKMVAAISRGDQ